VERIHVPIRTPGRTDLFSVFSTGMLRSTQLGTVQTGGTLSPTLEDSIPLVMTVEALTLEAVVSEAVVVKLRPVRVIV
jgi:hypothetical protein